MEKYDENVLEKKVSLDKAHWMHPHAELEGTAEQKRKLKPQAKGNEEENLEGNSPHIQAISLYC